MLPQLAQGTKIKANNKISKADLKITSKIQNNHNSEPTEIWLNGSRRTKYLKKNAQ